MTLQQDSALGGGGGGCDDGSTEPPVRVPPRHHGACAAPARCRGRKRRAPEVLQAGFGDGRRRRVRQEQHGTALHRVGGDDGAGVSPARRGGAAGASTTSSATARTATGRSRHRGVPTLGGTDGKARAFRVSESGRKIGL
jgi:hypothetical protein